MRIRMFRLGSAGSVSAGCLAAHGHDVIGVDVNPMKVDMINRCIRHLVSLCRYTGDIDALTLWDYGLRLVEK